MVTVKSFPVLAFKVVIITIVRIYIWQSFIALTSLLVSLKSSSRCHGFVCSLWLWYFLITVTYYLWTWIHISLQGLKAWTFALVFIYIPTMCLWAANVLASMHWYGVSSEFIWTSWCPELVFLSVICDFLVTLNGVWIPRFLVTKSILWKCVTLYSIITPVDTFEILCIWKYYGKWSICSFGANAPFSIIFSDVFKTLLKCFFNIV